jgi:hypothetical protein
MDLGVYVIDPFDRDEVRSAAGVRATSLDGRLDNATICFMHEALPCGIAVFNVPERNWFDAAIPEAAAPAIFWIISSMAISISNPIPMWTVFLAALKELALCPMALVPYFRQAPDRRLCFGAEETVPRE